MKWPWIVELSNISTKKLLNSVALVRTRTIPTSVLEALMSVLVKNAGWAHTSLWDLYFVESEGIKSKYSSIELLIHEALEYMKLKKNTSSELTRIFSLLLPYVVFEATVYFKYIF